MPDRTDQQLREIIRGEFAGPHQENRDSIHELRGQAETNGNRLAIVEIEVKELRKDFRRMETTVERFDVAVDRLESIADKQEGREQGKQEMMAAREQGDESKFLASLMGCGCCNHRGGTPRRNVHLLRHAQSAGQIAHRL